MATHFKGPLIVTESGSTIPGLLADGTATTLTVSGNGTIGGSLAIGSGGVAVKAVKSGTVSVDPGTLAAGDELDIQVAILGVAAGDIVQVMPPNAAAEAGLAVALVWISAGDQVTIRVSNLNAAAALVGGAQNWTYLWTDLT